MKPFLPAKRGKIDRIQIKRLGFSPPRSGKEKKKITDKEFLMGFMKFVIPFVGGAITAAAAAALAKKNREERDQNGVEIDAEFEEKLDSDNEQKS